MLDSISIRNIATFDETGAILTNLKKINFIYGVNGSGKTTISRFLNNLSDSKYSHCSVIWKNNMQLKPVVYNKDFREQNFGNSSIPGVFTLGQATKDEKEAIEKQKVLLETLRNNGIDFQNTVNRLIDNQKNTKNQFKEEIWQNGYKKNETYFKKAFSGALTKERFLEEILNQNKNNTSTLQSLTELLRKTTTIFIDEAIKLERISGNYSKRTSEIESDGIWQKRIVGKSEIEIGKLIEKLGMNDWVYKGKEYLQENDICPFCQQKTITADFKQQIEEYFDEEFNSDSKKVISFVEEYKRLSGNLMNMLNEILSTQKSIKNTKLSLELFSLHVTSLDNMFKANFEFIGNKTNELSRNIQLISTSDKIKEIVELITSANKEIDEHNKIIENKGLEKKKLISEIWRYVVEENKTTIDKYCKEDENLSKGITESTKKAEESRKEYKQLNIKIKEATKNVTSVQPTIDKINQILRSYGFISFKIVPYEKDKNQYQIIRSDGTIADTTLSEGEITFLTFLYYLQLAEGGLTEETVTEDRILVIDDPISSLDSDVLFVVSSMLSSILKNVKNDVGNVKQVIVLTHNIYFHKEVSQKDGKSQKDKEIHYWILRKNGSISNIQPYEMENPILNSYELLWKELQNRSQLSPITTHNTMRRIIENYFKILGKFKDNDLINNFETHEEQEICRSLLSWINDGSHVIPDDLFIQMQDGMVDRYYEVFRNIFDKTKHIEHYNMMMGIKNSA